MIVIRVGLAMAALSSYKQMIVDDQSGNPDNCPAHSLFGYMTLDKSFYIFKSDVLMVKKSGILIRGLLTLQDYLKDISLYWLCKYFANCKGLHTCGF